MKIVVRVERWDDDEGLSIREIGRLTLIQTEPVEGDQTTFAFVLDEGAHPLVSRPVNARGKVQGYPVRQSVWELIGRAVTTALCARNRH